MKINCNKYATELRQRNGLPKAVKIAEYHMKNTMPAIWQGVLNKENNSSIFTTSTKFNKFEQNKINLPNLNNFWVQVYNILKKQKV